MPLMFIGIAHSLFIAFFFLVKYPNELKDKIIAFFMISLALPLVMKIIGVNFLHPHHQGSPPIILFISSFPFTYGPFLFLYTRSMISEKPIFLTKDLLHFLPFAILTIFNVIFVNKYHYVKPVMPLFFNLLLLLSLFVYTFFVLLLLKKHERNINDYFSFKSSNVDLHWLKWIIISFIIAYFFIFIFTIILHFQNKKDVMLFDMVHWIGVTFYIFAFSFFVLQQPSIFRENKPVKDIAPKENGNSNNAKKYQKSGLKEDDASQFLQELEEYMKNEKPFCDGDLTIIDISEKLNIPKHYITQIVNERLNKNFYMYVNEYRVHEAMKMMASEEFRDYTILRIALESGFNSKSAFNTVFKKITNMSPSDYRRQIFDLSE